MSPSAAKKPYESALRAAQARTTRRAIVDAAAELFVEHGYGATTVDAIAAAAGVSRKTVFASVGSKLAALKLALDWAIVGDDEPVPMMERPHIKQLRAEPDARAVIRGYVRTYCAITPRVAPIDAVLRGAVGLDDEVRALYDENRRQRLEGMTNFAQDLARRKALRHGLGVSSAADLLWTFNDPALYHRLVVERGWPMARFRAWLGETLEQQLIDPDYRPGPGPGERRPRG